MKENATMTALIEIDPGILQGKRDRLRNAVRDYGWDVRQTYKSLSAEFRDKGRRIENVFCYASHLMQPMPGLSPVDCLNDLNALFLREARQMVNVKHSVLLTELASKRYVPGKAEPGGKHGRMEEKAAYALIDVLEGGKIIYKESCPAEDRVSDVMLDYLMDKARSFVIEDRGHVLAFDPAQRLHL